MDEDRKVVLLRAAYDMLKQVRDDYYVISPMEILTHYYGADCDGMCLMEDIANELGIEEEE